MRKPHPGYAQFIKEQKPKYGQTFLEWYAENWKIGDIELLPELLQKNQKFCPNEFNGQVYFEKEPIGFFKDFFTKKLQLCNTLISWMVNEPLNYDFDKVADIMDVYEDVIQEVSTRENIYVCALPTASFGPRVCLTEVHNYSNFNALKEEISTGVVIFYHFRILDNLSINARFFKWEPLTRTVLFEGANH